MKKLIARLMLTTILALSWNALSQEWLPDRASKEGKGVKVGDKLLFHPGAVVEGGYDTNPVRQAEPEGAGRLRISSYLDLATRSKARRIEEETVVDAAPPKLYFRFGFAGFYDMFFSDVPKVDRQDDFGVDSHIDLTLFPEGRFTLMLNGLYRRTLQPYDSPQEHHARHTIKPGIGMVVTPGGKTLSLGLAFSADVLFYDEDLVGSRNNRVMYTLEQETKWKIFPKTALISIVRFSPTNYFGAAGVNNDSLPVRAWLGIRGLLTPKFGLSLFVGYGASFYSKGDDFDHVIANGELMFFITPFTNLHIGGERDFVDSFYSNFYVKSGGFLKFAQMIGKLFQITLKGEVFYRDYSHVSGQYGYVDTPNTDDRRDTRFGATLLLEFRATEWLTILTSGVYQGNLSNFAYSQDLRTDTLVDFQRFEVMVGVQAHY